MKKMKNILLTIWLILFNCFTVIYSQTINNNALIDYTTFPQEKIFVHHNSSFLLVGEHLYYRVYCLNTNTNNMTNLSKIAYVELIGVDKTPVFKHKLKLNSGLGQGEFFIPASTPSGIYKLIAYTQWMRNGQGNHFFQADIGIVNPFQENQKEILKSAVNNEFQVKESFEIPHNITNNKVIRNEDIELKVNAKTFSNREKVILNFNGLEKEGTEGNISISVRKIDTIPLPIKSTAISYNHLYTENVQSIAKPNNEKIYFPELRG